MRRAPALLVLALAACRQADAEKGKPAGDPRVAISAVDPADLCTTKGALDVDDGRFRVSEATFRAYAPASEGDAAALRFVYGGPTEEEDKLASGKVRHQLGLKLRAADGCNLVYVMWRLDPRPELEVQVKRNAGKSTHAECGADGYTKVKPRKAKKLKRYEVGKTYTLQAEIRGDELVAWIDGKAVWQGRLPGAARKLAGPVGVRSDNVVFEGELMAVPTTAGVGCKQE